jgi:hypothetical protein
VISNEDLTMTHKRTLTTTFALLTAAGAALVALSLMLVAPVGADGHDASTADVVRESNEDGTAAPGTEVIGTSSLTRSTDGLQATVQVDGLLPGGVYTFWWVVLHADNPTIPVDVFVAHGAGTVMGEDGSATVVMEASTGQLGIVGLPALEGALWHDLTDPLNSVVRVEIAYHGQEADAGDDLSTWLSDFWSGTACPPDTPNPNAAQPHCPVYFAATHAAADPQPPATGSGLARAEDGGGQAVWLLAGLLLAVAGGGSLVALRRAR